MSFFVVVACYVCVVQYVVSSNHLVYYVIERCGAHGGGLVMDEKIRCLLIILHFLIVIQISLKLRLQLIYLFLFLKTKLIVFSLLVKYNKQAAAASTQQEF